jgi:hypothetical protein
MTLEVYALFQHWITLLPHQPGTITMIVAVIGCIFGLALWIAGARFSRSILTLAAVALGTSIGLKLPLWCKWSIDPMGPAVGAAVVLGVSAYVLHRIWVGAWLGAILMVWSALVLWALRGRSFHWRWPQYDPAQTLPQYFHDLWHNVPESLHECLCFCAVAALLIGISAAWLWPRIGVALLWSAAGLSLLLPTAATAVSLFDPTALRHLPRQNSAQLALLVGLIAAGVVFQWRMMAAVQSADSKEHSSGPPKKNPKGHNAAD